MPCLVNRLPLPAALRDQLYWSLPKDHLRSGPWVHVTPRGEDERRCSAELADHYEVAAYYAVDDEPLDELEAALRALPGVYRTARVSLSDGGRRLSDPDWPITYRFLKDMRTQVLALMRNPTS